MVKRDCVKRFVEANYENIKTEEYSSIKSCIECEDYREHVRTK
jgi:hypothetical protein